MISLVYLMVGSKGYSMDPWMGIEKVDELQNCLVMMLAAVMVDRMGIPILRVSSKMNGKVMVKVLVLEGRKVDLVPH